MSAYYAGLRLDTHIHIRMFMPQSTRQFLVLGRLYEKAHPRKDMITGLRKRGKWDAVKRMRKC